MESRSPLTIAIVEDNPAHRETYSNMILFDSSSHTVNAFENATDFLNSEYPISSYDCALFDIKLPDMNGIELSRKVREDFPQLPIVFITAYSDDDEALATLSEGAEDYLPKGEYNQKLFMRSIRYAIERKKYIVEHLKLIEDLKLQKELNIQQKEFVSMVSHEFRTPLAIISSSTQMIERLNPNPDDEKTPKHIEKIHNAIKRLSALIDNTLCYSKLEEGKIDFSPRPFNLKQHLREVVDNYRLLQPEIDFRFEGDALPEAYQGDAEIIQHALLNLLSNAVKYSKNKSDKVTINTRIDQDHNRLTLEIIDYGMGIPPAALERIGERFYRAENTTGTSGSGIGLHIVGRILEMHHGSLELKSQEGEGATASIILPLTPIAA